MERQESDDTKVFGEVGTTFDATPTNVQELADLPGGFTHNNQPIRVNPDGVPAKANVSPGQRGRFD